ncbi:hypothetical protein LEP1GSC050_2774 [Leptospira broomii serovar Hurstbridge str. 5399]|uniref:Uncharacterized protein n=1 Tax=Leptospira broomii serovar Hurstbridge str. 5399 TaxID=1049789 RepID=T0GEP3_9LEPT|nr:hypothetical protein [Leptospira broomii]EQA45294.1 hypothetical protein LEP1GSC050_2774 [Leptospira broomii serovar Hurstbridge str. 5399]
MKSKIISLAGYKLRRGFPGNLAENKKYKTQIIDLNEYKRSLWELNEISRDIDSLLREIDDYEIL